jgi:Tol biopolymer transport system component
VKSLAQPANTAALSAVTSSVPPPPGNNTLSYLTTSDHVINTIGTDGTVTSFATTSFADFVPGARVAWSPDGTRIAYVSNTPGNPAIYVKDIRGGVDTRLTTDARADANPAWSADGRKLAFDREVDPQAHMYRLFIFDFDTASEHQVGSSGGTSSDREPAWSPPCPMAAPSLPS